MIVTLAGGPVGTGVYFANAGDDPQEAGCGKQKAETDEKRRTRSRGPQITEISNEMAANIPSVFSLDGPRTTKTPVVGLCRKKSFKGDYQLEQLFEVISEKYGVTIRARKNKF